MLTDEVRGSIAVRPKGDVDAGELIDNVIENKAVCLKSDTDVEVMTDEEIEIENDAVRPKCDIDAEETTDNMIERYAVCPKSDMDAEVSEEDASNEQENENETVAAKKTREVGDEVSKKDVDGD